MGARHDTRWRRWQRLLVWCLLVSLPLVGLSGTLTQLLGPRHFHTRIGAPQGVVAWLRQVPLLADLRQMRESAHARSHAQARVQSHPHAHPHSHDALARHHHAAGDDSVVVIDGAPAEDGAADAAAEPTAPVWAFALGLRAWLLGGLSDAWPPPATAAFASAASARRERPPKG